MGTHAHRPEPSLRQLMAIARDVVRTETTEDHADLVEAIKCRIARGGWAYPSREQLADVVTRVVLDRRRPDQSSLWPAPASSAVEHHTPRDRVPLTHQESVAVLLTLRARFGPLPALKPRPMPADEGDLLTPRERYALVHDIERLRTIVRLRRANAAGSVHREGDPDAEGIGEGLRAEVVGGRGRGGE